MSAYFKNTELAAIYGISESTVRNWVKSAKNGKLQIKLVGHGGRMYVAKSIDNISIVEKLIRKNRKYRNTLAVKSIHASTKLFDVFNETQVYDIVRSMEIHHEIPHQYVYFGVGVQDWEEHAYRQMNVGTPNMLTSTIQLLDDAQAYIDRRLADFDRVNVIDVGVGDGAPVRNLLTRLRAQNKLGRYVGLDFSAEMLNLARRHLFEWFGDDFGFEGYQLDIAHERFANLLAEDYLKHGSKSVNVVLFLGATPNNLRVRDDAFRVICESMNPNDLFIYTDKLEPPNAPPEWLELEARHAKPEVSRQHRVVCDLIGIEESLYDFEVGLEPTTGQRFACIRFKVALTIHFPFDLGERVINFEKGDTITLWRCWQTTPHSLISLLEDNGFYILQNSQTPDRTYALTISEVKKD